MAENNNNEPKMKDSDRVIPLRVQKPERTPELTRSNARINPNPQDPSEIFRRSLLPIGTPTLGRSIKFNDSFVVSGVVEADPTVATRSNSDAEGDMNSFTFPNNSLHLGSVIRLTCRGVYSTANSSDTVTIRVGLGSAPTTALNTIVSTAATRTNASWQFVWIGIITAIGSSGTIECHLAGNIASDIKDTGNTATQSINTTSSQQLTVTTEWSNALAGNTISLRQFIVEVLN